MSSYNTAVCMMALLAANKEEYAPAILKGRAYLIKQQNHFAPDNPYNGGIGYGDKKAPPSCRPFQHHPGPGSHLLLPEARQGRQIRGTAGPGLERRHGIHQPLPAEPSRQQGTLGLQ